MLSLDPYITEVLMRDLVGHDHRPVSFLIYLWLVAEQQKRKGEVQLPISSIAITANDRPLVYASDDDTFTLTGTSNSLIGTVARWVETGIAVVEFDAALGSTYTAPAPSPSPAPPP